MPSQVTNGKAFEWALATEMANWASKRVADSSSSAFCRTCHASISPALQARLLKNSFLAVDHIVRIERIRPTDVDTIRIQSDESGQEGDVRDVVISLAHREVGISCKNNHNALKHSRLSDSIDFVKAWGLDSKGCSRTYWESINPIFARLREQRSEGRLWNQLPKIEKEQVYWAILDAFEVELKRVVEAADGRLGDPLIGYLIGKQDFYKVISRSKNVEVYGFNFFATMKGIPRTRKPEYILGIDRKNGGVYSKTVRFSGGFTVNFRIHNASSRIEPSLKFDIKALAWPEGFHKQIILHG